MRARSFFPALAFRPGRALPLSTLLLAALCMVLAAPASQAASRDFSRDAILSVLQRGELTACVLKDVLAPQAEVSGRLSVLEIRRLRTALSRLDKHQLLEIQKHLTALMPAVETPKHRTLDGIHTSPVRYASPSSHFVARHSGVRTNRNLE